MNQAIIEQLQRIEKKLDDNIHSLDRFNIVTKEWVTKKELMIFFDKSKSWANQIYTEFKEDIPRKQQGNTYLYHLVSFKRAVDRAGDSQLFKRIKETVCTQTLETK